MVSRSSNTKPSRFRRVVTSRGPDGRSRVAMDGPGLNFGTLHELWSNEAAVLDIGEVGADPVDRPLRIIPPGAGTIFRMVEIEPEANLAHLSDEERRAAVRRAFAAINSEDALVDTARHPGMHQTETVDYIVVLQGRLTMLLDEGEVELNPFDVVVQRGANHAWVNKSDQPALLAAVLVGAT